MKTPETKIDSIDSLMNTPVASRTGSEPQLLANLATLERRQTQSVINHFNIQPVYDIYANAQGRDLGGVITDINKIVAEYEQKMSPGNHIFVRGLVVNMDSPGIIAARACSSASRRPVRSAGQVPRNHRRQLRAYCRAIAMRTASSGETR